MPLLSNAIRVTLPGINKGVDFINRQITRCAGLLHTPPCFDDILNVTAADEKIAQNRQLLSCLYLIDGDTSCQNTPQALGTLFRTLLSGFVAEPLAINYQVCETLATALDPCRMQGNSDRCQNNTTCYAAVAERQRRLIPFRFANYLQTLNDRRPLSSSDHIERKQLTELLQCTDSRPVLHLVEFDGQPLSCVTRSLTAISELVSNAPERDVAYTLAKLASAQNPPLPIDIVIGTAFDFNGLATRTPDLYPGMLAKNQTSKILKALERAIKTLTAAHQRPLVNRLLQLFFAREDEGFIQRFTKQLRQMKRDLNRFNPGKHIQLSAEDENRMTVDLADYKRFVKN